jgi:signal transduction histidine kinase
VSTRDVTDRIEERLRRLERLETIGQLTSGIIHDFNNLLTSLLGNLELLRARLGGGDPASARLLSGALKATERGARLTAQLLAFSRQQTTAPDEVDLNRLISGMEGLLQSAVGAGNRIETALADPLSLVCVDPSQIEFVILKLAINARDAMPSGGTITIRTGNVKLDARYEWPEAPPPGDYVMCSVTDTGMGIANGRRQGVRAVFDDTGSRRRVRPRTVAGPRGCQQLGGGVRIETRPGAGTTVSLYFPRADGEPASGEDRPEPRADREHAVFAGR